MPSRPPLTTDALPPAEARTLQTSLAGSDDVTVFVDGTSLKLPAQAREAVVDVLHRLAAGDAVMNSSVSELLTTSQAAEAAGISHTYLRNLTDAGVIPVEYRGTHRRIRLADVLQWRRSQHTGSGSEPGTP
jgi:excisionase family DNA binding protein